MMVELGDEEIFAYFRIELWKWEKANYGEATTTAAATTNFF